MLPGQEGGGGQLHLGGLHGHLRVGLQGKQKEERFALNLEN